MVALASFVEKYVEGLDSKRYLVDHCWLLKYGEFQQIIRKVTPDEGLVRSDPPIELLPDSLATWYNFYVIDAF